MDEKQTRLLTWLSAFLLVLVAILVFAKPPEKKDDEEGQATWTKAFADASADKVKSFALTRGEVVLRFTKDGEAWKVAQGDGPAFDADARKVDAALDAIIGVETSDSVADAGAGGAEFGLDPATVIASVETDAATPLTLRIGRDTPVGYGTYVQTAENGAVFSAHAKLSGPLGADGAGALSDFRDKAVARFSGGDVTAITLRRPGEGLCAADAPGCATPPPPLNLEKDAHGWWITGATRTRADEARISELIQDLTDLRAEAFLPMSESPSGAPAVELELKIGDGAQVFTFGPVEDGARVVQGPLQPEPLRIKDSMGEALARASADWVDPHLLPTRTATATKLDLKLGEQALSATRSADGWTPANGGAVIDAISAVRIDRRAAAPAPSGPAWGSVEIAEGDTRKEQVQLFQALPDGGRVGTDAAGGAPFVVPATEVQRMIDGLKAPATPAPSAGGGMPDGMPPELLKALSGASNDPPN